MTDTPWPSSFAPLSALPCAVLDLETTGLNVGEDRVVQVGVVGMLGARIEGTSVDEMVNPRVPIPSAAVAIHGIDDGQVAQAAVFADVFTRVRAALAGRVVVGHHIAFDLAVLRFEAARAGIAWQEPPSLDVALLLAALEPTLVDLSLEGVTRWLGVRIGRRHSALGDAEASAAAFAAVIPRLRAADVRTLGEAMSLAARRQDLVLQQARSGWFASPGQSPAAAQAAPVPRIDSYLYERTLGDLMSSPPVSVAREDTLDAAARLMVRRRIGALLVCDVGGRPDGILTERDLLRVSADGQRDLRTETVAMAMSAPVQCMRPEEPLYRVLGRMDRLGLRHLCAVDAAGVAVGVVSQRDLLQFRARGALEVGDAVASAGDDVALAAAFGRLPQVVQRLVAENVGGIGVARVVSSELRAVTARAAHLAIKQLGTEGKTPPAPWCLLVLGSGGRGESLLAADQDNALIYTGPPELDGWFKDFGAKIAASLDRAGVPFCKGGVMASDAAWRGGSDVWRARIGSWLGRARPEDLLHVDIFFDMAPVAGDEGLAWSMHGEAVRAAAGAPPFLALLAASTASLMPLLGMFGRLRTQSGRVDLKRCALLPIVSLGRALALRVGSSERTTPGRLRDAAAAERLSQSDTDLLVELQADVMSLILGQQLFDLEAGIRPSSRVDTRRLPQGQSKTLARQLRRLEELLLDLPGAMSG
jgi:DNA polymerase-3 subunit epsilon/CBS domain-containing protein